MTQTELERAVCRATGETREVIKRIGFSLLIPPKPQLHRRRRYRRPRTLRFDSFQRVNLAPKPA
jgi:hypothetical protein